MFLCQFPFPASSPGILFHFGIECHNLVIVTLVVTFQLPDCGRLLPCGPRSVQVQLLH